MANFYASYPVGGGGSGGGGGVGTPTQAFAGAGGTIVGPVNGVNTVFTLPTPPTSAASVEVFLDGLFQRQGVDYTVVGSVITFTAAPLPGQFVDVFYDN
jgi:hypothetical protein